MLKTYRQHINESHSESLNNESSLPKVFVPRNIKAREDKYFRKLIKSVQETGRFLDDYILNLSGLTIPDWLTEFPKCRICQSIDAAYTKNLTPKFFKNFIFFQYYSDQIQRIYLPNYFTIEDVNEIERYIRSNHEKDNTKSRIEFYIANYESEEKYEEAYRSSDNKSFYYNDDEEEVEEYLDTGESEIYETTLVKTITI
jgi:hypothetical protein